MREKAGFCNHWCWHLFWDIYLLRSPLWGSVCARIYLPWSQLREFSVLRGVPEPRLLYIVGSFPWKLLTVAVYSSPSVTQQNIQVLINTKSTFSSNLMMFIHEVQTEWLHCFCMSILTHCNSCRSGFWIKWTASTSVLHNVFPLFISFQRET